MMSKTVVELLVGVLEQVGVTKRTGSEERTATETTMSARMGVGSWIIIIVLLLLLVATCAVIYFGWTLANATDVPTWGYAAMAFGEPSATDRTKKAPLVAPACIHWAP